MLWARRQLDNIIAVPATAAVAVVELSLPLREIPVVRVDLGFVESWSSYLLPKEGHKIGKHLASIMNGRLKERSSQFIFFWSPCEICQLRNIRRASGLTKLIPEFSQFSFTLSPQQKGDNAASFSGSCVVLNAPLMYWGVQAEEKSNISTITIYY
jgi:hypothetical protein